MRSSFKLLNCYNIISTFCTYLLCSSMATEMEEILDESHPILISDELRNSSLNISETFFGYQCSLVEGKTIHEGKSSGGPDGWIFISAPRARSLPGMYEESSIESGVIWRCSLGKQPDDTCEIVNIDPTYKKSRKDDTRPDSPRFESHDGAWVGASLEVNHNRFVTCGMRWNRGNRKYYNGICYWFSDSNSVTNRSSYRDNDLSKLVDKTWYDQRLMALTRKPDRNGLDNDTYFEFVSSTNVNTSGNEWKLGQSGVSVHLFHAIGSTEPNLLIGAPGVREWSGAVILYTNTLSPREGIKRVNRNPKDPTFSEFLVGNRGLIPNKENTGGRRFWNEYFGYSVSTGRYLSKDKVIYASGAPRAELSGEVVLFDYEHEPSMSSKRQIRTISVISAPKHSFGSYFGSVLHTVDIDGDSQDELIVGAPLFTFDYVSKDGDHLTKNDATASGKSANSRNFQDYGDHGCVFIYKFQNGEENSNARIEPTQTLFGSKIARARFGTAISSLAFNLNYPQGQKEIYLIIGAPYEISGTDDDPSSGAVYLYKYDQELGKFGDFVQRIIASTLSKSLNGFGSSLSIAQDIDDNETPDIAIGSYKSGHVVILRTRPKIRLKSWIKFFSAEDNANNIEIHEIRRDAKKFYLKSCFSVVGRLGLVKQTLDIWVKVYSFDPAITLNASHVNNGTGSTGFEILNKRKVPAHTPEGSCIDFEIFSSHKYGVGMNDSDDFIETRNPLQFIQEVWYNETLNRPLFPVSYHAKPTQVRQEALKESYRDLISFEKRKPSSQVSKSVHDLPISSKFCRKSVCQPEVKMTWSFYNENNENISIHQIGSGKEIKLQLIISNSGETAENATLTLDWKNQNVKESPSGSRWLHRTCNETIDAGRTYVCFLGRYLREGRNISIEINLAMDELYLKSPKDFNFDINGRVSFSDRIIEPFESKGSILVRVPPTIVTVIGSRENDTIRSPLKYSVSTKNSLDITTATLYSPVRQRFTIEIEGAYVEEVTAHIKIPVKQNTMEHTNEQQTILVKQLHQDRLSCHVTSNHFGFHQIYSQNAVNESSSQAGRSVHGRSLILDMKPKMIKPSRVKSLEENDSNSSDLVPIESTTTVSKIAIEMKPRKKPEKVTSPNGALKLSCSESEANCLEITCTAKNVKSKSHIHAAFELYLVKDVIDSILESTGKTSLFIESTGTVHIFSGGSNYEDSDVAQTILEKVVSKGVVEPWWYVVSGISGLFILVVVILGLYKCGFFKREKLEQLNHMKAEHHRKSMIAAARASIMQSGSFSGAGLSLEGLTEAEQENEDKEPDKSEEDAKDKL